MLKEVFGSLLHPAEISAMIRIKFGGYVRKTYDEPLEVLAKRLNDVDFCYAVLVKVSRSFAAVIQQLPEQLKDPVCIFYLVLRGLDSVEDDMEYPNKDKIPLLQSLHDKLEEDGWRIEGVGDSADYRILMANFDKVISVYKKLDDIYKEPIKRICKQMGDGMAQYAEKKVTTMEDYNKYCHYVAGLVGFGLSDLFANSGLEDADLKNQHQLSNSMGLFLQKTNIIRDYLEDLDSGRTWWPDEIWSKHAKRLADFKNAPTSSQSMACLNELVTDALQHVPDVVDYLQRLSNKEVFRFAAIPQVMAIGTLAAVYNNPNVFRGVVKLRKGLTCKMMIETNSLDQVNKTFHYFVDSIERSIPKSDPSAKRTRELVAKVKEMAPIAPSTVDVRARALFLLLFCVLVYFIFLKK